MFQSIHQSTQSSDNSEDDIKAKKESILDPNAMMHGLNRSMQMGGPNDPANSGVSGIAQAMFNEEDEKPAQMKTIQKAEEEEEVQMKESSADSTQSTASGTSTQSSLPRDVNAKMEASFNTNFSNVNIHTNDSKAAQMKALAFTQGNNVHFAPGQYNPHTSKGQELIGHEYTHVVQQGSGNVAPTRQAKGMSINDNPALEHEADVMGKKAAEGRSVDVSGSGTQNEVQRKQNDSIKGEIGLNNGSVDRSRAGVTVSGQNAEGEKIRPAEYGSEAEYQKSEKLINELETTAPTHAFFEFVAHFLAYQEPGYIPPEGTVKTFIVQNGFEFDGVYRNHLGFQFVRLESKRASQNDIVAFRGTNGGLRPSDLATIYTDTNPTSVGFQQYINNKGLIKNALDKSDGKVDIAGHSLGGGVAQIVASYHTSKIGNVYTFQSPGIDDSMVKQFNSAKEEDKPNIFHHVAVGDMVDKAGEESLPGNVYMHDFGTYWIKTQELLKSGGNNIKNILKGVGGVSSECNSINTNVLQGILGSGIPLIGDQILTDNIIEALKDINDLQGHIRSVKSEASDFKTLMGNVLDGVGEAHTKFLFSSNNFADARADKGLNDDLYTNTDEEKGAGQEVINESSVVTAHESYPLQDERKVAEPIRDAVGTGLNMIVKPEMLFLTYKSIDIVIASLVAIEIAMKKLVGLLQKMASSAWEAVKSIPSMIKNILYDTKQLINDTLYDFEQSIDEFFDIDFGPEDYK